MTEGGVLTDQRYGVNLPQGQLSDWGSRSRVERVPFQYEGAMNAETMQSGDGGPLAARPVDQADYDRAALEYEKNPSFSVTRRPQGNDKYDYERALYEQDQVTGEIVRKGDWEAYKETPSKDNAVDLAKFIAVAVGGYYAVTALAGAGAAGAAQGATAATAATAAPAASGAVLSAAEVAALGMTTAEATAMGITITEAGAAAASISSAAGSALVDKALLFGTEAAYGSTMSSSAISAFDTVLAATGSTGLASVASSAVGAAGSAVDWLAGALKIGGPGGSLLGGSSLLPSLLNIVGAGVAQYANERDNEKTREWSSAEKQKDRDWQDKREADTRRRQMPGRGMIGRAVVRGGRNGN